MKPTLRVVIDTNVLISRLLAPKSVPGRAVSHVVRKGLLLMSEATFEELVEVISRPKFDKYLTSEERREFLRLLHRIGEITPITHRVSDCADPKDNQFLELALSGEARVIITGDGDLLKLHPFRGIPILKPADYLSACKAPT